MKRLKIKERTTSIIYSRSSTECTTSILCSCSFTVDDWELYDEKRVEQVAARLNREVENAAKNAGTKGAFLVHMRTYLEFYSAYGADDSEPHWLVDRIATVLYGEEE